MHTFIKSLSLFLSFSLSSPLSLSLPPPPDRENRPSLPYESLLARGELAKGITFANAGSARIVSLYFVNPGFEHKFFVGLYLERSFTGLRFCSTTLLSFMDFSHRLFLKLTVCLERVVGRRSEGRKSRLVGNLGARVILDLFISFTQLEFGFAKSFL